MKLVTIPDVKTFLEISLDSSEFDNLLSMYDDMVSDRIQLYLNRYLKKASYTEVYDAGHKMYFFPAFPIDLSVAPVVSVAGVTINKDVDYYVWEKEGVIEMWYEWAYFYPRMVSITCTGGFTETPAAKVIGTDALIYTCKADHVSTDLTKPITGSAWDSYWSLSGSSGDAWVKGVQYLNYAYLSGISDSIKLAALIQIAFMFKRRKSYDIVSISTPDGSMTRSIPLQLLDEVKSILTSERRRPTTR